MLFRFQSSPGQKAGCNVGVPDMTRVPVLFQSSPGQKAGCNRGWLVEPLSGAVFQSSPGQKAGCNGPTPTWHGMPWYGFNPHPARRPDAIGLMP